MYISIEDVSREFYNQGKIEKIRAISHINLQIKKDEFICIVGPSGCGKTVLLNMLAGFEKPSTGRILIDGQPVTKPTPSRVTIFQDYGLLPWRTVRKNIELGLEAKNGPLNKASRLERKQIADKYMEMVGLTKYEQYYPIHLSGGMKQRVAIARALAVDPDIIFMDEPFGALDYLTKRNLQDSLIDILDKGGKTVLFVTHNVEEAVFLADRIVILSQSPATIREIIRVTLPRKRDRGCKEFIDIREKVIDILKN